MTTNCDAPKCLQYFQKIANLTGKRDEIIKNVEIIKNAIESEKEKLRNNANRNTENLEEIIRSRIENETSELRIDAGRDIEDNEAQTTDSFNQTLLNVAFRSYYKLIEKHKLVDEYYNKIPLTLKEDDLHASYSMLLAKQWPKEDVVRLNDFALNALKASIETNNKNVLLLLKILNIVYAKHPFTKAEGVNLNEIYHLMQVNQQGLREETLIFFKHLCKNPDNAAKFFSIISMHWPWTNRQKYYLLSCILHFHNLLKLLNGRGVADFFNGLRLSLSNKSLFAASQYLVNVLSRQKSEELLDLCIEILTKGNLRELENFQSQWFSHIAQKDDLFVKLQAQPDIVMFLCNDFDILEDSLSRYRIVLIFYLFSQQIFDTSRLLYFKISTEFLTNCFQYEFSAQLLIYKFIVENLQCFDIEDSMIFIANFINQHKTVDNSHDRNGILNKVSTIVNYIAKTFKRLHKPSNMNFNDDMATRMRLEQSVIDFFHALQSNIDADIDINSSEDDCYQKKAFATKLLELLVKSLYADAQSLEKNAKNCNLENNAYLGSFLVSRKVFKPHSTAKKCLLLLNDPNGYDDVMDLFISILQKLKAESIVGEAVAACHRVSHSLDIDDCALSYYYVKAALSCMKSDKEETAQDLWRFAFENFSKKLPLFEADPLNFCKNQGHLFGYLYILNDLLAHQCCGHAAVSRAMWDETAILIELLNKVVDHILVSFRMGNCFKATTSASFKEMDESLQYLVESSVYKADTASHVECRKFLLMSFWLTLKASCNLSATMGSRQFSGENGNTNKMELINLGLCFQINLNILTSCRHKGAIESSGLCIGKLVKAFTRQDAPAGAFSFIQQCILLLLCGSNDNSTTRRGAGYSIMLLQVVKNEDQQSRRLLHLIIKQILNFLSKAHVQRNQQHTEDYCDRLEALYLHYLCALVKDAELRESVSEYYNEIIMAAIAQIDHIDWTICNGALQLFGAIVPKIIGQRQLEEKLAWETTEISYEQARRFLPAAMSHILEYCKAGYSKSSSTRSIVLFLSFLSKVEYLKQTTENENISKEESNLLKEMRDLTWSLLKHNSQKVRELAAIVLVRAHAITNELPHLLFAIINILFDIEDEDFYIGLLFAIKAGWHRFVCEAKFIIEKGSYESFRKTVCEQLIFNFQFNKKFTLYTRTITLEVLRLLGIDFTSSKFEGFVKIDEIKSNMIGCDAWTSKLQT